MLIFLHLRYWLRLHHVVTRIMFKDSSVKFYKILYFALGVIIKHRLTCFQAQNNAVMLTRTLLLRIALETATFQ